VRACCASVRGACVCVARACVLRAWCAFCAGVWRVLALYAYQQVDVEEEVASQQRAV
jgi:hypothetical protein